MSKQDLYDENGQPIHTDADSSPGSTADSLSELFGSVDPSQYEFEEDENAYYHTRHHLPAQNSTSEDAPEANTADPGDQSESERNSFHLGDYTDYDTYNDSGTYRSYDGSSEYRSFDAAMPEAPKEGWYHFSEEDSALEDEKDYEDDEEEEEEDMTSDRPRHRLLRIFSHILLTLVTLFCGFYLMVLYAPIPALTNLRDMYIRTAMTTLNHKWLATAIVPSDIIDQVMLEDYAADDAMVGKGSNWGNVSVQELPTFADSQDATPETASEIEADLDEDANQDGDTITYSSQEEEIFYQLFYELDYHSMTSYLEDHPDALSNGWSYIDINEAGLDDNGTDIKTVHGDQVLALDAYNGVLLVRVKFGASRGVMAICKDTSRLSLCSATTLPVTGQTAGKICDNNNGVVAITGSAFLDDGTSNGGQISGLAVCEGEEMGSRLGGAGDKRLELRNDDKMYIVDSSDSLSSDTRDACEFHPALIIDGENLAGNSTWTSPNPRAVLGQSSRLETMMVVVEGRLLDSPGCSVVDIADKMEEYGCVQALNLDGGTSAIMYYKGEYVTRCSNTALPAGRTLPSAWVYKKAN